MSTAYTPIFLRRKELTPYAKHTNPSIRTTHPFPLTHSHSPIPTHSLTHSPTHPLTHSPTHPLTHSPTHPLTHSPTHPLTHSPTHPLTHSPTHPLTHIINKSKIKPLEWKRYIDDVFSLWDTAREEIAQFVLEANRHHPAIKFTAEISDKETLDTSIFKGERFHKDSSFDISTHFKPDYTSCQAPGVKKGFLKGEALRLLRTNSSETRFEESICNFKSNLLVRGYPDYLVNKVLAEVKFTNRRSAHEQKPQRVQSGLMPFVTQYNPSVPNLKNILMSKWHLIENQPLLREIYREPPFISYRKGKSLKDILVRAKL